MDIQSNPEAMRHHLDALFADADKEYPDGLCEIAWADARGNLSRGQMFSIDEVGLKAAVDHAVDINKKFNVYVGINPRKPGTPTGRANGDAVDIAFHSFIDLDDGKAVAVLSERSRKLPATFIVITGRQPSLRIHAYWKLDEPVRNLKAWEDQQAALAAHFSGDPVTDPPRVMRLAGTVSYPSAKKIEKGYQPELVTIQYDEDRDPVAAHALAMVYPPGSRGVVADNTSSLAARLEVGGFDIATCISDIGSSKNLHNNALSLVAHLVQKNCGDHLIQDYLSRILEPVSDGGTIDEIPKLIASARKKFQEPDPKNTNLQADDIEAFLALEIPPREMILTPFLPSQGLVMLFAARGIGKTHLSLGIGYAVATGSTFLRWTAPKARRVLFIDGEMPATTMQERLAAIVAGSDKEPSDPNFLRIITPDRQEAGIPDLSTSAGQAAVEAVLIDSDLLILDNLSSLFRSGRENEAEGWVPEAALPAADPFDHPDAQRRFRLMTNLEELQRALDFPWEKWTIFLHPEQRHWIERDYNGPARVSGSAGTGKTIVALHRATYLARTHTDARVLLTTFSDTLANALQAKLKRLLANEPRLAERIDVYSLNAIGMRLYKAHVGQATIASRDVLRELLDEAASTVGDHKFGPGFLLTEWEQVVDAWQLEDWDAYRDVVRLGRKTRLPEAQRMVLWSIFEIVRAKLKSRELISRAELFSSLADVISKNKKVIFDFAVVDEAQDISVAHLRFFAALGKDRPNSLFFAGDLGQRIFQQPFSWKSLGVDIRGRSRTLRVNYRTSHQIRMQSDRLLGPVVIDVDGNSEDRSDTVSVFNGPPPTIQSFRDGDEETEAVANWITEQTNAGVQPHEFGVFVRSVEQLDRAQAAAGYAGMKFNILDDNVETTSGHVSITTMHQAKGLEFRAVAVMACDDEVIPLQERIETVGDDADLQEVYDTERHLLYVACTRARDHLLVTGVAPASEFLDDIMTGN